MELEFRAWDLRDKEYMKVHTIHFGTKKIIVSAARYGNTSMMFDEVVIEQFSGFLDRREIKLFIGDIVSDGLDCYEVKFANGMLVGVGLNKTVPLYELHSTGLLEKVSNINEKPYFFVNLK